MIIPNPEAGLAGSSKGGNSLIHGGLLMRNTRMPCFCSPDAHATHGCMSNRVFRNQAPRLCQPCAHTYNQKPVKRSTRSHGWAGIYEPTNEDRRAWEAPRYICFASVPWEIAWTPVVPAPPPFRPLRRLLVQGTYQSEVRCTSAEAGESKMQTQP